MVEPSRLEVLLQECTSLREHIDSFREFVDRYDETNPLHLTQLQIRSNSLAVNYSNIDNLFNELSWIDAENNYTNQKRSIQDAYFEVVARAQTLITVALAPGQISDTRQSIASDVQQSTASGEHVNGSSASTSRAKIKLPQIALPSFSGRMEDWLAFKDDFNSVIDKRDVLSDGDKLSYLKSALKHCELALKKIVKLSNTAEHYKKAWDLLKRSYEDKRQTIASHMNALLGLPSQTKKETWEGLNALADEAPQHAEALISLGVNIPEEVVVAIIESKLNKDTFEKWETLLKRNVYPKLEELTDFLYLRAARLSSKRKDDSNETSERSNSRGHPAKKRRTDGHSFVTAASKSCPVCSAEHPIYKCEKFIEMPVNERFQLVKNAHLCYNCLKHHEDIAKNCKLGACKKCKKKHNTLLHFSKKLDNDKNQA